ncbi:MAG TPA: universal stress protein [Ktedonobacteraceae bacterium]|nr:universal stress protein [Ktedonobacteraceae bacterium]
MFKRILVPLDGSLRAERALTIAARLARAADGTVILLQVIGLPAEFGGYAYGSFAAQNPAMNQEVLDAEQAKAMDYLKTVRQSQKLVGVKVETTVEMGLAASTIQGLANEERIDLIVMCSHGDTGFKRWVLGSVAQKVSRASQVPVLVLREDGTAPDNTFPDPLRPLRSIMAMVALDGSEFAESAITPAATLVAALATPARGMLLLTHAMPPSEQGNTPETQEQALSVAQTYLRDAAHKYAGAAEKLNVTLQTAVSTGKDVVDALIRAAERGDEADGKRMTGTCDLIAITTHGRGGLQRLAMGSVTESMLGATKLPLLVVHSDVHATR